jgi:enoyl-CoA hydratase
VAGDYCLFEKDKEKRIAWITFNRPEKLNMMRSMDGHDFAQLLRQIEEDDDIRVLILRGAGEAFGTGADMGHLGPDTMGFNRDPKASRPSVRKRLLAELSISHDAKDDWGIRANSHFLKPCISQVHGYCYGWHFEVMAQSDIAIASEEALFTHPALRYIAEPTIAVHCLDNIGYKRTAELMLTGRAFTAQEMLNMGMVNSVVPRNKLDDEVMEYASVIALQPLDTLMMQKYHLEIMRCMRHQTLTGDLIAALAHVAGSYMKTDPGDFIVMKETANIGAKAAAAKANQMYPPRWRLDYKGRAAKE